MDKILKENGIYYEIIGRTQKDSLDLNEEFNIPTYVDEYLTILYGDWRTPSRKHSPSLRKQARLFSK